MTYKVQCLAALSHTGGGVSFRYMQEHLLCTIHIHLIRILLIGILGSDKISHLIKMAYQVRNLDHFLKFDSD